MNNKLDKLTVRQLQVYAAICLKVFCKKKSLRSDLIDQLIQHLVKVASSDNLPQWEQDGANLELNGRGDPLPMSIVKILSKDQINLFQRMIEYCVEVGIVDMYGDNTEAPRKFVDECLAILKKEGIQEPSADALMFDNGDSAWGEVFDCEKLNELEDRFYLNSPRLPQ